MDEKRYLTCPIRGPLGATELAKDGLTITEEARRIDFLKFLLGKKYPKENIAVETVIIKNLGESGRNKLRCDVISFKRPINELRNLNIQEKLKYAVLVAEIKRDSRKQASGIKNQLEPSLKQLPSMNVMGAYWDDTSRLLFVKFLKKTDDETFVEVHQDNLENLPDFGISYKSKALKIYDLSKPDNLMSLLYSVADVMRSHGINDDHLRYKETVKLILARYCDETEAESKQNKELQMQVFPGGDAGFYERVQKYYKIAAKRYSRAKNLFSPKPETELEERTLREIIKLIQPVYFRHAGPESMQQVFQSFVPAVFKKKLDQFFTPNTLIETMVEMVEIGPLDKVVDPAMGTGDFLTGAMDYRTKKGDADVIQRVFGMDIDSKAFDLAIINMILNRDGQSNLFNEDSIKNSEKWSEEVDISLCNPPFGENSVEKRGEILKKYDLGHLWKIDESTNEWYKTDQILDKQQLGILFIERCFKFLPNGGRLAIILPEGYLCTTCYGYVRKWILENLRVVSLIELPRRIFLKSSADLKGNVLVAQKVSKEDLKQLTDYNYPIHTEIIRKVGYKLGKGYSIIPLRDPDSGIEVRDQNNEIIPDTDFVGARLRFQSFKNKYNCYLPVNEQLSIINDWDGGEFNDINLRVDKDMKPRRLSIKSLENIRTIKSANFLRLVDIANVVEERIVLDDDINKGKEWRLVAGQDIRAHEGMVFPEFPAKSWEIIEKKSSGFYKLNNLDIIIGLVRPERRNIGILIDDGDDIIGSPDGISVVRIKDELKEVYPQEWLFSVLRSEKLRLQFWTESGGTTYGKLTKDNIENVLIPIPSEEEIEEKTKNTKGWVDAIACTLSYWKKIWDENDRKPMINSPIFGLEPE